MTVKTGLRAAEKRLGLSRQRYGEGECPGRTTYWTFQSEGEPEPLIPPNAKRCHLCGAVHVMNVVEVVVDTREQADAAIDTLVSEAGLKRQ